MILPFTFVFGVLWWTGGTGPPYSSALTTTPAAATAATTTTTQALSLTFGSSPPRLHPIPRIPAADFDPHRHYYHTIQDENGKSWRYETPVIIEHVFSAVRSEQVTDALIAQCGQIDVTLQRKRTRRSDGKKKKKKKKKKKTRPTATMKTTATTTTTTTELYTCSFRDAIDLVLHQSSHEDAWLAFCEGFLRSNNAETPPGTSASSSALRALQTQIEEVREGLFQPGSTAITTTTKKKTTIDNNDNRETTETQTNTTESRVVEDPCWFRAYFPAKAAPTDCVILAGAGATSTLHRDPYEWTGTNLCLDGTKVWRFVAPSLAVAAVEAERTKAPLRLEDPTSVGGDPPEEESKKKPHCSFVSEIDHYLDAYRLDSIAWGGNDDDDDDMDPMTLSAGWQSEYSLYAKFQPRISSHELEQKDTNDKFGIMSHIAADLERLQPDLPKHHGVTMYSGVQNAGDMIVIPAHWWHQTYAMEASLAIASQRCGADRDIERVLQHILETSTAQHQLVVDEEERIQLLASLRSPSSSPQEIVDRLFDYLSSLREKNI